MYFTSTSLLPDGVLVGDNGGMPESIYEEEGPIAAVPEDFRPTYEFAHLGIGLPGVEEIVDELMGIVDSVRSFHVMQPDMVMQMSSAYSARLTELAMRLQRVEGANRRYTSLRTQQVQRLQDEIDRQFKIASRLVEIARQDLDTTR